METNIPTNRFVGQARGRVRATTSIIISLLVHLLFSVLFVQYAFLDQAPLTLQTSLAQEDIIDAPAALKPRASNFGSTVFFDNSPAAPSSFELAQERTEQSPPSQTQAKIDLHEFALQNLLAEQRHKEPAEQVDTQPKKQNVLQATAGYLENLKQKGTDEFEREGDENKFPSLAEVKYLGYVKRALWSLQKAWKVQFAGKGVLPQGIVVAGIAIDTSGKLVEVTLLTPSSNAMVNDLVQQHVHAATFPPVPNHFGQEVFRIAITFHYEGLGVGGIRFA